jgi:hypothetical protein
MTTQTERQRTTEMLHDSQLQVHVNKDRAGVWRLKESHVPATRAISLSLRPECGQPNVSTIEWLSISILHDLPVSRMRHSNSTPAASAFVIPEISTSSALVPRINRNVVQARSSSCTPSPVNSP